MANSRSSGRFFEYATVDTAIDSTDELYSTNEVNMAVKGITKMTFSVAEAADTPASASVVTVTLQFKRKGDAGWQDAVTDSTISIGSRLVIDDPGGGGVRWRAIVKWDGYTSGSVRFGFDWR